MSNINKYLDTYKRLYFKSSLNTDKGKVILERKRSSLGLNEIEVIEYEQELIRKYDDIKCFSRDLKNISEDNLLGEDDLEEIYEYALDLGVNADECDNLMSLIEDLDDNQDLIEEADFECIKSEHKTFSYEFTENKLTIDIPEQKLYDRISNNFYIGFNSKYQDFLKKVFMLKRKEYTVDHLKEIFNHVYEEWLREVFNEMQKLNILDLTTSPSFMYKFFQFTIFEDIEVAVNEINYAIDSGITEIDYTQYTNPVDNSIFVGNLPTMLAIGAFNTVKGIGNSFKEESMKVKAKGEITGKGEEAIFNVVQMGLLQFYKTSLKRYFEMMTFSLPNIQSDGQFFNSSNKASALLENKDLVLTRPKSEQIILYKEAIEEFPFNPYLYLQLLTLFNNSIQEKEQLLVLGLEYVSKNDEGYSKLEEKLLLIQTQLYDEKYEQFKMNGSSEQSFIELYNQYKNVNQGHILIKECELFLKPISKLDLSLIDYNDRLSAYKIILENFSVRGITEEQVEKATLDFNITFQDAISLQLNIVKDIFVYSTEIFDDENIDDGEFILNCFKIIRNNIIQNEWIKVFKKLIDLHIVSRLDFYLYQEEIFEQMMFVNEEDQKEINHFLLIINYYEKEHKQSKAIECWRTDDCCIPDRLLDKMNQNDIEEEPLFLIYEPALLFGSNARVLITNKSIYSEQYNQVICLSTIEEIQVKNDSLQIVTSVQGQRTLFKLNTYLFDARKAKNLLSFMKNCSKSLDNESNSQELVNILIIQMLKYIIIQNQYSTNLKELIVKGRCEEFDFEYVVYEENMDKQSKIVVTLDHLYVENKDKKYSIDELLLLEYNPFKNMLKFINNENYKYILIENVSSDLFIILNILPILKNEIQKYNSYKKYLQEDKKSLNESEYYSYLKMDYDDIFTCLKKYCHLKEYAADMNYKELIETELLREKKEYYSGSDARKYDMDKYNLGIKIGSDEIPIIIYDLESKMGELGSSILITTKGIYYKADYSTKKNLSYTRVDLQNLSFNNVKDKYLSINDEVIKFPCKEGYRLRIIVKDLSLICDLITFYQNEKQKLIFVDAGLGETNEKTISEITLKEEEEEEENNDIAVNYSNNLKRNGIIDKEVIKYYDNDGNINYSVVYKDLDVKLKAVKSCNDLFFVNDKIGNLYQYPQKVINAIQTYGEIRDDETILFICDTSMWKTGKSGFILTDKRIIGKEFGTERWERSFTKIKEVITNSSQLIIDGRSLAMGGGEQLYLFEGLVKLVKNHEGELLNSFNSDENLEDFSQMDLISKLKNLLESYNHYQFTDKTYLVDNPYHHKGNKLNLVRGYKIKHPLIIPLIFIDNTVFNSGKNGLLLTTEHLCYRNVVEKEVCINITSINTLEALKSSILINGEYKVEMDMLNKNEIKNICDFVNTCITFIRENN